MKNLKDSSAPASKSEKALSSLLRLVSVERWVGRQKHIDHPWGARAPPSPPRKFLKDSKTSFMSFYAKLLLLTLIIHHSTSFHYLSFVSKDRLFSILERITEYISSVLQIIMYANYHLRYLTQDDTAFLHYLVCVCMCLCVCFLICNFPL